MLPRSARLTSPNDFSRTTKSGFRFTSSSLVTYLYLTGQDAPVRAGLIISKSTGGSVVRHAVARQLRHGLRAHLEILPKGALIVVRTLPSTNRVGLQEEIAKVIPQLLSKSRVSQ